MRKPNISRFCLLGIAAILALSCLVLSVGTAMARYHAAWDKQLLFTPRGNAAPVLGIVDEFGFTTDAEIAWEVDQASETAALNFAVGNLDEDFLPREQTLRFRIRIIGSISAWELRAGAKLLLRDGTVLPDGTPRQIQATVTPIGKDTALHRSFGDGWVFEFLDEAGEPYSWTLPGGDVSAVSFSITLEGGGTSDVSLLQLQIISEPAG